MKGSIERKYPRKLVEISANYKVIIDGDNFEWRVCKVLDISIGGLKLLVDKQIKKGVDIEISFQDGTELDGIVTWLRRVKDDTNYSIGIRFKENKGITERKMKNLLRIE